MTRVFCLSGCVSAFLAVAAGAFAAHGLRPLLTPAMLDTFVLASQYQLFHALALLAAGWLYQECPGTWAKLGGNLLITGSLLFCGSLYLLATTGQHWLGPVTPLGGLCFLGGWLALARAAWDLPAAQSR